MRRQMRRKRLSPLEMLFNTIFAAAGGMTRSAVIKIFLNVFIKE